MKFKGLLTVREAAESLRLSKYTLYRLCEKGKIPYLKLGRGLRFKAQDLEEWFTWGSFKPLPPDSLSPKVDLALDAYDRLFLKSRKGGVKVSPKGKTWNYPFGSVFLRLTKSGKEGWYIYYRTEGKRVRKAVKGAQSRSDALKVLQVEVADAFRGKYGFKRENKAPGFKDFAAEFLKNYSEVNKKSADRDRFSMAHLKAFKDFQNKTLLEISPLNVEAYKAHRKAEDASPATINRELACLKTIFNKAVEWGKIERNPISRVKKFKEPPAKERILTNEEIGRLLFTAKPHLKPILIVLLNTGMRKSEVLSLRWENVDLRKGFIYVGASDSKSDRSRTIPMSSLVLETLEELRKGSNSEYIFVNPETKKHFIDVTESFKTACRNAEVEGLRIHDLRHTAASKMVEAGVDLVTVSKILGHSSIQMTMRYAHPTPENMRRAVEVLARICPRRVHTEKGALAGLSLTDSLVMN
jgi:excisionase family DNA binding protein